MENIELISLQKTDTGANTPFNFLMNWDIWSVKRQGETKQTNGLRKAYVKQHHYLPCWNCQKDGAKIPPTLPGEIMQKSLKITEPIG